MLNLVRGFSLNVRRAANKCSQDAPNAKDWHPHMNANADSKDHKGKWQL
jgi:hypothetical protein